MQSSANDRQSCCASIAKLASEIAAGPSEELRMKARCIFEELELRLVEIVQEHSRARGAEGGQTEAGFRNVL